MTSEDTVEFALREADKARAAKRRFMQTASNDIRHHLQTLVLLNAALAKTVDDPKAQKMFAMQGDAMGHLSDLMNSLLDLTDMESGAVEVQVDEVQLEHIFALLDQEFRGNAEAKALELEIVPTSDVARTDPNLLTQALRSLVANAIRYTEEGKVSVYCLREGNGLRVVVRDTGIGIAKDHLADIFDEFYRVEHDPAGRNLGLGLGLTIVDRITRLLDISLEVESRPGKGSSFSLLLPNEP
jgi:two-component system CheB/CheR fusion protein